MYGRKYHSLTISLRVRKGYTPRKIVDISRPAASNDPRQKLFDPFRRMAYRGEGCEEATDLDGADILCDAQAYPDQSRNLQVRIHTYHI